MVGFGQAEAAYPFAGGQFGQKFLLLCFTAVFVDGVHDQRALHADGAAVAAVHALNFAGDQAVSDVAQAGAAVAFNGAAQKAHGTGFVHDLAVKFFMARGHQHAGLELFLAKVVRCIDDGALVVAELLAQKEWVFPAEFGGHGLSPV